MSATRRSCRLRISIQLIVRGSCGVLRRICAPGLLLCFLSGAIAQTPREPPTGSARRLPRPLAELEHARGWKKARIAYSRTTPEAAGARYYSAVVSGSDVLVTDHGDEDGVVARYADGAPQPYGYGPFHTLQLDRETWLYGEGQIRAEVLLEADETQTFDLRTLGAAPTRHAGKLDRALRSAGPAGRFESTREDGYHVVRLDSGSGVTEWRLDPRRGGAPVRVTVEKDGQLVAECRSELREFNGVWYPGRVEYFRSDYRGGHEPVEVIEVTAVALDPPDVPDRLMPALIGIDAGVNLYRRRLSAPDSVEALKWDGRKAVTLDEYLKAAQSGAVRDGPIFLANIERSRAMLQLHDEHVARQSPRAEGVASAPALPLLETLTGWEAYTRRFIDRYRLDSEQTQRAISILRQCQAQGEAHLARVAAQVEQWERASAQVRLSTRPAPSDAERAERLRAEILAPLAEIFRAQLEPRLDALPTRAQRKAVQVP